MPDGRSAFIIEGGDTVRYVRTPEDDVCAVVNELGEVHTIVRDARGMVVREVGFDARTHGYVRDLAGRVTQHVLPDGMVQTFAHDVMGRVTSVTHPDGAVERYAYDTEGRLSEATNASGSVHFARDATPFVRRAKRGSGTRALRRPAMLRQGLRRTLRCRQEWNGRTEFRCQSSASLAACIAGRWGFIRARFATQIGGNVLLNGRDARAAATTRTAADERAG